MRTGLLKAKEYVDHRGVRRRSCCETTFSENHSGSCYAHGTNARLLLACQITSDGWCAAHSTGAGPVYCASEDDGCLASSIEQHNPATNPECVYREARA